MKRPLSHKIEDAAKKIFKNSLPDDWIEREQGRDYGVDYIVEPFDAEDEATGRYFAVQLKGIERLRFNNGTAPFQLETKHLVYYLDRMNVPVFLVVADVSSKAAYWLHLQEYAKNRLSPGWRDQKKPTLHLLAENVLTDHDRLAAAVAAAHAFMLPLNVAAEQRKLEDLDRRFRVRTTITDGQTRHALSTNGPVEFTITIRGSKEEVEKKAADLIDRGVPVHFSQGSIEGGNSDLIRHMLEPGCVLQFARRIKATVTIAAVDAAGRRIASIRRIPGIMEGGRKEVRYRGRLPGTGFNVRFITNEEGNRVRFRVNIRAVLKGWLGQPVSDLNELDEIVGVFDAIRDGARVEIECRSQAGKHFGALLDAAATGDLREVGRVTALMNRASIVARAFHIPCRMPDEFKAEHIRDIEYYHRVVIGEEMVIFSENARLTASFARVDAEKLLADQNGTDAIRIEEGEVRLPFLGAQFTTDQLNLTLQGPREVAVLNEQQGGFPPNHNLVRLEIVGRPGGKVAFGLRSAGAAPALALSDQATG